MSAELLLLVCAANVCRSPLAELLLRRELDGLSEVRVESAGVGASDGARICELVAERHADAPWVRAAQEHRSRSLTPELLASAALVLVADREVRSEVVRMSPGVRDRIFTLRDAALLIDSFEIEEPARRVGRVSRMGIHLNRHRAVRGPQPPARRRLWGRREEDPSSIDDGHNSSLRHHHAALEAVSSTTSVVAAGLMGGPIG
ncbi:MAG TPA: hypothetical protein K8U89_06525 [Brachybacterium faecium]|nr:hypothetical protein [Brachybacterium faecium]